MTHFQGKVALVTGAMSGIGRMIFLCSNDAAFITGASLTVDGRFLLG